ncbi:prenyltransferase/squalene oxidase repeat-containing protein [Kitasatospora sp. NPDC101801]|uniref:prenyltransferase/squalene oxidase repeat-containing protein n=1 Tax=Kitasatospora sp. NPDC101801 TaxID=3364103 RepID=UPI0037F70675
MRVALSPQDHLPWPSELFPAQGAEMRLGLTRRLAARVDGQGALREPCQSRVLESVLALRLLERTGLEPARESTLRGFLLARAATLRGADLALVAAALKHEWADEPDLLLAALAAVPGFTAARKRSLLNALAVIVDSEAVPEWDEAAFDVSRLHSWAAVQVTAVKVILADAAGRLEQVDDEDVRRLLDTQRAPHVWEGNVLIQLSVLHALARLPGTAAVVESGVRKVLEHQRPDGGMPFVSDTDTWCTATAGMALAAAGAPEEILHRIAGHLIRQQQPAGGWSYTDLACQTDVDDTSVAVQFLHQLDAGRYREPIERGIRSLYSVAAPDGGFPTYQPGAPSEAAMTAAALDALTHSRPAHESVITRGLRYLASQQHSDGSFPPDWSSSRLHTVFRVLLAAARNGGAEDETIRLMTARSLSLVLSQQNQDGGFGQQAGEPSDVISTAYGLIALCTQSDPGPAVRAVAYLIAQWQADGGVTSRPDSIGPRLFTFTVPVLAEIFTLLALGHLHHRLAPAVVPASRTAADAPAGAR